MVFRRPKFFLDLGGGEDSQPPAVVAPPAPAAPPAAPARPAAGAAKATSPVPGAAAPAPPGEGAAAASGMTTAEAIAAELAAAEALRPAPSLATFAPDCITPGGAMPVRRRTAGANLGVFKEMAAGMMRS